MQFANLHKAIYGLNQASRQFYRRITTYLQKIGFVKSHVEPCLLRHTSRQLYLAIYVDDVLTVGNNEDVKWFSKIFEEEFEVRTCETVTEYIGTQLLPLSSSSLFLHQSRLTEALLVEYKDLVGSPVKTPGVAVPSEVVLDGGSDLPHALHQRFMSAVGSLNYLVKCTRPDLANSVRALSKKMRQANSLG